MDQSDYRPPNPFESADPLWLSYAGLLADDGDRLDAARVLGRLQSPWAVINARLDRRFAAIIAASPDHFDPKAAADRQLARDLAAMTLHPELARGVTETALDYRLLGRAPEALELLDHALTKVAVAPPSRPAYSDLEMRDNWLADGRASTLADLGRFDESITAMRQGAALKEDGNDNVSQVINLAEALEGMNRPQEALDILKVFGSTGKGRPASPYGVVEMMATRACGFAELRQTTDLAAALAYLSAHERDNPAGSTEALLCAGDLPGAAASYIRRLADPDSRQGALLALSDYSDRPPLPPHQAEVDRRWRLVRDRPDVRAAVAAVGHVETIPLRGGVF